MMPMATSSLGSDPADLEAQHWAWMTTALMDGATINLWAGDALIRTGTRLLPQH